MQTNIIEMNKISNQNEDGLGYVNINDKAMEKSIFDFTWSRLDTMADNEIKGFKEVQEKINNLISEVIEVTGREDIKRLLETIEEACMEQSVLVEEKAYRLGLKDGLKLVNSL